MSTKTEATVADLYGINQKAELIDGEIVVMSPTGDLPARASGSIYVSLRLYEKQTRRGYAYPDNVGFLVDLPHRRSFSPDAAFYSGERTGMKFLDGAPIFAAEVRSENDYGPAAEAEMAQKRADYFAAGTLIVWDVDLLGADVVRVHRADQPQTATRYHRGEEAEAEPALPGWTMPVDDLFD